MNTVSAHDLPALAPVLSQQLGCELRLALADSPLSIDTLTPYERAVFDAINAPRRRETYLLGRAALRQLLPEGVQSEGDWPRMGYSLTHIGTHVGTHSATHDSAPALAIAVAAQRDDIPVAVGIDLERVQSRRPGLAQRVLTASELAQLEGLSSAAYSSALIRLWSIKEAVWKAASPPLGSPVTGVSVVDAFEPIPRAHFLGCEYTLVSILLNEIGYLSLAVVKGDGS